MKPEIIQNGEFIEVIGHYDDEVQCAKMTLLAELYAVEHRDGYAKFRLEDADKLELVNERLEFIPTLFEFYIDNAYVKTIGAPYDWAELAGWVDPYLYDNTGEILYTVTNQNSLIFVNNVPLMFNGEQVPASKIMERSLYFTTGQLTPRVSIDLTALSGWSGLSDGSHSITVKAKATGYRDSEASQAVSVTKAPSGDTWVLKDSISISPRDDIYQTISFTSNNTNFYTISIGGGILSYDDVEIWNSGSWVADESYKTITFHESQIGDLLTWLQANAVKQ